MSQTLTISNYPKTNILEETELTADAASAQAVIAVINNQNFAENTHYVIGRIGGESLEKLLVLSVSGTTGITATTNLARSHSKFDKVTRLFGNKIRIYRAANADGTQPADGSFALLTTVDIDFDGSQTEYTDDDGSSSYWYKHTFYDSVGLEETPLSGSGAVRGGGIGNYASIESIRKQAGLENNRYITDPQIEEKRQSAQKLIDATLTGLYTVPFTAPINPLIAEITRLYAAGLLLTSEFGGNSTGRMYIEGKGMMDSVTNTSGTGLLDKLNKKELKLVGLTGDAETVVDAGGYSAWPTGDTATTATEYGGGARKFRSEDRY